MNQKIKSLLKSLGQTKGDFWNISPEVGQFINLIIKDREYKSILEIGTSNGYSGVWIAKALSHTKGHLYTIESNEERFNLAKKTFKKCGLDKYITQILGHAPEDIPKNLPPLDLAFFDATKSEHPGYFRAVALYIKKGGMIITDNIISHRKALVPYIKAVKSSKNWRSVELSLRNGLLVSIKIHPQE